MQPTTRTTTESEQVCRVLPAKANDTSGVGMACLLISYSLSCCQTESGAACEDSSLCRPTLRRSHEGCPEGCVVKMRRETCEKRCGAAHVLGEEPREAQTLICKPGRARPAKLVTAYPVADCQRTAHSCLHLLNSRFRSTYTLYLNKLQRASHKALRPLFFAVATIGGG